MTQLAELKWRRGTSPKVYRERMKLFRQGLRKAVVPPMNKRSLQLRKDLTADVTGSRMGRGLFGSGGRGGPMGSLEKKRKGHYIVKKTGRFSRSEGAWVAGAALTKIPGWIAGAGGRMESAGTVRPRKAKRLVFRGSSGRTIFAKSIEHRGARVRGRGFADKRLAKLERPFLQDVKRTIEGEYSRRVAQR